MIARRIHLAALGFPFLAGLSCGSELDLETWQGEYVLYETSESLQVCQGTHAWVDNFVPFVAEELGLEVTRIQNYRWLEEDDYDCSTGTAGCATGNHAFSPKPFLLHELVHTVLFSLDYPYQPFFGEGIAFALDPWYGDTLDIRYLLYWTGADQLVDPRPWMSVVKEDLNYYVAGSFVMFLLARHGSAKFLAFIRELGTSRDMEVINKTFHAAYGLELDGEAELFMTGAPCTEQSLGPGLYDCTSPDVPWGGEIWGFDGAMDCASEAVAGGIGPERAWPSIRSVTLDVPVAGLYQLTLLTDSDRIGVRLGPCSSCPWETRDVVITSTGSKSIELEAGIHFVRIQAQSDEAPAFQIVLRPLAPAEPGV